MAPSVPTTLTTKMIAIAANMLVFYATSLKNSLLVKISRIVCEFTVEQHFSLSSSGSFASDSIDTTMSALARLRFVALTRELVVTGTAATIAAINAIGFHVST